MGGLYAGRADYAGQEGGPRRPGETEGHAWREGYAGREGGPRRPGRRTTPPGRDGEPRRAGRKAIRRAGGLCRPERRTTPPGRDGGPRRAGRRPRRAGESTTPAGREDHAGCQSPGTPASIAHPITKDQR